MINTKEVKFRIEMDISLFYPDGVEPDTDWLESFIRDLTIDLPEDMPEEIYCLTQVQNALCVKFGQAEITK